jgi:hypothetical protein
MSRAAGTGSEGLVLGDGGIEIPSNAGTGLGCRGIEPASLSGIPSLERRGRTPGLARPECSIGSNSVSMLQ